MLDELEEDGFPPLDVVEQTDERLYHGTRLDQLAEGPRDLVRGGRGNVHLPENDPQRVPRRLVREGFGASELLHDLHDGPVGDPLPVGEAASLHHLHVAERAEELVHEPRLPHAG